MKAKRIKISGKVQGVFYRVACRNVARELNISGFVKNLPDGSVLIEASGDQLQEFIDWCKSGPENAQVEDVDIEDVDSNHDGSFEIRYV